MQQNIQIKCHKINVKHRALDLSGSVWYNSSHNDSFKAITESYNDDVLVAESNQTAGKLHAGHPSFGVGCKMSSSLC
jgi:hypothetical protein